MQGKSIGAVVLIVLGVVFLAANHGWIPNIGVLLVRWWPLILIIVGVALLLKRNR
jgi:membrane-bound ClpP family serine protease